MELTQWVIFTELKKNFLWKKTHFIEKYYRNLPNFSIISELKLGTEKQINRTSELPIESQIKSNSFRQTPSISI
ncbi:hypothetical protein BpHYR1_027491 [Brachionus plicatilis]|uniref:Uncharacterized protein n=1 Tax=Brachionus plicatilis TaxID=10195 RepID=A0A3M7RYF8_BRAPC|nr:hypothetical protein BpHYR1_027491 [Brachionus plicatilis]